jgi:hypothetical protein
MGKRPTGVKLLNLGEEWRRLYLLGLPILQIALKARKNAQDVSRAIWLAKIPSELKLQIRAHPETFTRTILMNMFAAKRKQCEQEGFKRLRLEIERLISKGAGTQPKLRKTNKKKEVQNVILSGTNSLLKESNFEQENSMSQEAAYRIQEALGFCCQVVFEKTGELSFLFKTKKL